MTQEQVERPPGHAFISYVREDAADVDRLQGMLEAAGIRVWRDTENLWPGQDWKTEIKTAITNDSLAFIACFSKHSQQREKSYQNEELILAVEEMRQRIPGRPWLIPVRFSECTLPQYDLGAGRSLDSIQRVDLFDQGWEQGGARLVAAVMRILGALQVENTGHSRSFRSTAGAAAVLAAARAVGLLIETCRQQRRTPSDVAAAWRAWREQVAWSMPVYDRDGNRLTVEPPMVETRAHEAQLSAALAEAVAAVEPIAATVITELHAVRAADAGLARWCQWVQTATESVVTAAGRWPGNPPTEDDQVLLEALTELQRASAALSAAWRQEQAAEPPEPPPTALEPVETDQQRLLREHRELLDTARPWARSQRRPYDAALYARLIETAQYALKLPHVPSLLPIGLQTTARLAAAVARNADDPTYRALITKAAQQHPLAVSVNLVRQLMFTAQEAQREELAAESSEQAIRLLREETWQDPQIWSNNQFHVRPLLGWTASVVGDREVRAMVATTIDNNSELLPLILRGTSEWVEHRDRNTWAPMGLGNEIGDLPPWFPTEQIVAEIQRQMPSLVPVEIEEGDDQSDEIQRLASQVLRLSQINDE